MGFPSLTFFTVIAGILRFFGGAASPGSAMTGVLRLRRARPRPLRTAQAFESLTEREHADVVEAAADDLHADRKAVLVIAAVDGEGRIFRHVPRHGVADVLERLFGIVEGGSVFGREADNRRDRRDDIVQVAKELSGSGADRHSGVEASD